MKKWRMTKKGMKKLRMTKRGRTKRGMAKRRMTRRKIKRRRMTRRRITRRRMDERYVIDDLAYFILCLWKKVIFQKKFANYEKIKKFLSILRNFAKNIAKFQEFAKFRNFFGQFREITRNCKISRNYWPNNFAKFRELFAFRGISRNTKLFKSPFRDHPSFKLYR